MSVATASKTGRRGQEARGYRGNGLTDVLESNSPSGQSVTLRHFTHACRIAGIGMARGDGLLGSAIMKKERTRNRKRNNRGT